MDLPINPVFSLVTLKRPIVVKVVMKRRKGKWWGMGSRIIGKLQPQPKDGLGEGYVIKRPVVVEVMMRREGNGGQLAIIRAKR